MSLLSMAAYAWGHSLQVPKHKLPVVGEKGVLAPQVLKRVHPKWPKGCFDEMPYIVLQVLIKKDGRVGDVKPVRSSHKQKTCVVVQARKTIQEWRFTPGKLQGEASDVLMYFKFDVHMQ